MFIWSIGEYEEAFNQKQYATTFQLSEDVAFNDIVFEKRVELPNNILSIVFNYKLKPMKKYFVRAIRHFEDENEDEPTEVDEVMDNNGIYHRLVYKTENRVEKPWIHVNKDDLLDHAKDSFEFRTSKFRAKESGHVCTHWIIEDGSGKVIFKSLRDKENKTSIMIKKTGDLLNRHILKFKAIHVGTENVESEVGYLLVNQESFNYEIVSPVTDINPGFPYQLLIRRITDNVNIGISLLQVMDDDDKVIYQVPVDSDEGTEEISLTLPFHLFRHDETVHIVLSGLDANGYIGQRHVYLKTSSGRIREVEDPDYVYENKLEKASVQVGKLYSDGVYSIELPEGYIPMPQNGSKSLFKYKFDQELGELVSTGEKLKGAELLSEDNNFTFIKYTENGLLLVDCYRDLANGKREPVLLVYRHFKNSDSYSLINMLRHPDADTKTIYNNNLIQVSPDEFLYLPNELGKIFKFNTTLGTCEEVAEVPLKGLDFSNNVTMFKLSQGRIYISGGSEPMSYIFNLETGKFRTTTSYSLESFYKTTLLTAYLVNGDVVISKRVRPDDDFDSTMLVYNNREKTFKNLDIEIVNGETPNGSITLLNNTVLLTRRATGIPDTDGRDRYIIYKYI